MSFNVIICYRSTIMSEDEHFYSDWKFIGERLKAYQKHVASFLCDLNIIWSHISTTGASCARMFYSLLIHINCRCFTQIDSRCCLLYDVVGAFHAIFAEDTQSPLFYIIRSRMLYVLLSVYGRCSGLNIAPRVAWIVLLSVTCTVNV